MRSQLVVLVGEECGVLPPPAGVQSHSVGSSVLLEHFSVACMKRTKDS